ncbi:MAG TPA: hypothetical protein VFY48_06665 [Solirubrobacterales bacterium]|nr:hypothetical protein [Solirubrobacterales bacterium]
MAAALLMALAVYFFLQTLVEALIGPAIAALFGEPSIYLLSFTVNHSEFAYGSALAGLILLVLAFAVVVFFSRARRSAESDSTEA